MDTKQEEGKEWLIAIRIISATKKEESRKCSRKMNLKIKPAVWTSKIV
ncbi:hypothetical protein ACP2W0_14175 [Pseudobacillus badius]|nr:hypothetical protein [Bacillus badius]MED0666171.1 hypothetical protein [Bacillus badius]TDW02830.1 hypothetical protein B0G66_105106 [Bacillus badius]UAT30974.1 hypothetical protein K7T73_01430 [Bacillus badius]